MHADYLNASASDTPTSDTMPARATTFSGMVKDSSLRRLVSTQRLARILANLLSNALKYSAPDTEVTMSDARGDGQVVVSVSDRGPGIPPEQLGCLFQRHYRGEAGRERREAVGLGLYIARKLIEAHGGRIWAEFPDEGGSLFVVELPHNLER